MSVEVIQDGYTKTQLFRSRNGEIVVFPMVNHQIYLFIYGSRKL